MVCSRQAARRPFLRPLLCDFTAVLFQASPRAGSIWPEWCWWCSSSSRRTWCRLPEITRAFYPRLPELTRANPSLPELTRAYRVVQLLAPHMVALLEETFRLRICIASVPRWSTCTVSAAPRGGSVWRPGHRHRGELCTRRRLRIGLGCGSRGEPRRQPVRGGVGSGARGGAVRQRVVEVRLILMTGGHLGRSVSLPGASSKWSSSTEKNTPRASVPPSVNDSASHRIQRALTPLSVSLPPAPRPRPAVTPARLRQ